MTGSAVWVNLINLKKSSRPNGGESNHGPWSEKDGEGGSQGMKAGSHLEGVLEKGMFAVTGNSSPKGATSVSSNEKQGF